MQVKKPQRDSDGRWTVEFTIPHNAVITLRVLTEESAVVICKALNDHVTFAEATDLRTTVKPAGYQGISRA